MGGEISAAAGLGNAVIGVLWMLTAGVIALFAVVAAFVGLFVILAWRIEGRTAARRHSPARSSTSSPNAAHRGGWRTGTTTRPSTA